MRTFVHGITYVIVNNWLHLSCGQGNRTDTLSGRLPDFGGARVASCHY